MNRGRRWLRCTGGLQVLVALALVVAGCKGPSGGDPGKPVPKPTAESKSDAGTQPPEPAAPRSEVKPGPGAVAVVNGEQIEDKVFASDLGGAAFLAKQATMEGRREVLDRRIGRILMIQDARRQKYPERPLIARMIERRRRLLVLARLTDEINRSATLVATPERAAVVVGTPPPALDLTVFLVDTAEDAERALARIRGGESMEAVADEVSVSPGTGGAGRHVRKGYVPGRGLYPVETDAALSDAPVGTILPPQPTPVGYAVLRVDARKAPDERQIQKMRESVRDGLFRDEFAAQVSRIEREQSQKVRTTVLLEKFHSAQLPDPKGDAFSGWWALESVSVARVGGTELTLGDLFRDYRDYVMVRELPSDQQQGMYVIQRDKAVNAVLRYRHALERGLGANPEIDRLLAEYLNNVLEAEYAANIAATVRAAELADGDLCRGFFEEHKARYASPGVFTLSQILVRRQEEERLVRQKLRIGKDFAALAREHSVAPEASRGGDLGVLDSRELEKTWPKEMVAELVKVAARGERGPVTFRTSEGFHVVIIRDFKPAGFDFSASKKYLLPDCFEFFRQKAVTDRVAELRKAAAIGIDEVKLASIQPTLSADGKVLYHGGGMSKPAGGVSPHGGGPSPHGGGHGASPPPQGIPGR